MDRRTFFGAIGSGVVASGVLVGRSGGEPDARAATAHANRQDDPADADARLAKVDLHAHLEEGGGQEMADRYAELGFDVLVGTDHRPGDVDAETAVDYSHLEFPGPILNGAEMSIQHHVNVIRSENELVKQIDHPMRYDDTAEDVNRLADRIGADLVEVATHGNEIDEYPTVSEAAHELDPSPTITSDAHGTDAIGDGYVVVEVEELTGDAVVRALAEGRFSLVATRGNPDPARSAPTSAPDQVPTSAPDRTPP